MYRLVNVPSAKASLSIEGRVNGMSAEVVCVDPKAEAPFNRTGMADLYIGDHMLAKPNDLRKMVADALAFAVRAGRDAGYSQAQADIRQALGVNR